MTMAWHTGEPCRGHSVLQSHLVSDTVQRVIVQTRAQERLGHGIQETLILMMMMMTVMVMIMTTKTTSTTMMTTMMTNTTIMEFVRGGCDDDDDEHDDTIIVVIIIQFRRLISIPNVIISLWNADNISHKWGGLICTIRIRAGYKVIH